MRAAAIIVAAGQGHRFGSPLPKQFLALDGRMVLEWSLLAFANEPEIDHVVVVLNREDRRLHEAQIRLPSGLSVGFTDGGTTRNESVRAGLGALSERYDVVLIHDAARPLVDSPIIRRVLAGLERSEGAAPAVGITDALWLAKDGRVIATQSRKGLLRAQTPQGFRLAAIQQAHAAFQGTALDDVEVALASGLDVAIVEGDDSNLKITLPGDIERAEYLIAQRKGTRMDVRTGNGFDVHAFGAGEAVTICGVSLAHDRGLVGHSDADVGLHALSDAIYGALADGDIGRHFPPSDPQWKGAPSDIFLRHACERARERGYKIANADCTLICERPKIGPHADKMRRALADILEIDLDRVSVKATTSERLGFTGREEGIAALATVTLLSA